VRFDEVQEEVERLVLVLGEPVHREVGAFVCRAGVVTNESAPRKTRVGRFR
jgi:hypothetical protein